VGRFRGNYQPDGEPDIDHNDGVVVGNCSVNRCRCQLGGRHGMVYHVDIVVVENYRGRSAVGVSDHWK
jgi:hypothetical protein